MRVFGDENRWKTIKKNKEMITAKVRNDYFSGERGVF